MADNTLPEIEAINLVQEEVVRSTSCTSYEEQVTQKLNITNMKICYYVLKQQLFRYSIRTHQSAMNPRRKKDGIMKTQKRNIS